MTNSRKVLVTGATGYIGGRLVPRLVAGGESVRVMVRDPARVVGRDWFHRVDVARGDVFDRDSLAAAMVGMDVAYYNIHSMSSGAGFHERDAEAARGFGQSAHDAGVQRIVYLGGLGDPRDDLSDHLRSRQMTGEALASSGVPVTEFRAAIVVGAGSVSFEMIRYLTERLPVMICPRWVFSRAQPIAISNVLDYLVRALDVPDSVGRVVEIGGTDVLTYGEMMTRYAAVRGLKRTLLAVPVLTPRLSSYWVHLMTPIPASISGPLIEGLKNEVVVRDDVALRLFPDVERLGYDDAVRIALRSLDAGSVETAWSDALVTSQGASEPVVLANTQGMHIERRKAAVDAPAQAVFRAFTSLGGAHGWLAYDWAWRLRGSIDRLVGGVGLRRGRRHPERLRTGDAVDFWRVEQVERDRSLRLRAEMKLPGKAWLEFEAIPTTGSSSHLIQTAYFAPRGALGALYWYALYPFHAMIFSRLVRGVADLAEASARESD